MAEIIKRFKIPLTNIVTGDCVNPTVSYSLPQGITVPCVEDDYIIVEIDDSAEEHCIVIRVDCEGDCTFCGPFQERWCFCTSPDDCDECEKCENNVCVTRCEPGQLCEDDLCVDCDAEHPCPKNQLCLNGKCVCPAEKPILREDGLCVDCLAPADCDPCQTCDGAGNCVQKECDGFCHPVTGVCQECVTDDHCTDPNECCGPTGQCECCNGYLRDALTGVCIPAPECFSAQDCIDALGPCHFCDDGVCANTPCPNGQVCNPDTGDCEYPCTGGDCPDGQGCLNGFCVPCDTLSCAGTISECQLAVGCTCNDGTCEGVDCITGTTGFQWVQTPGTPGTVVPGTGESPLAFNITVTAQGIYTGYLNYAFDITATNGSGSWSIANQPGQALPIPGASSTHVNFNLANGPVAGNVAMFIVTFTTPSGNTADILFFSNLLTDPNSTAQNYTWQYDINSNGLNAQSTGGSSGSLSLCSTNPDLIITQVTGGTIQGDLQLFFNFTGTNCAGVSVAGCGKWEGTVTVDCGGSPLTFPIYYEIPEDACCNPVTDPTCEGDGDADGCTSSTNQNIELYVKAYENGRWAIVPDYDDVGLSPWDWFFLNPTGCWSKSANPDGDNDTVLQTTITGTFQNITFTNGGCVQLGESCDLKISACVTISGEACFDSDDCGFLTVFIESLGNFRYRAHPSQTGVSYVWTSNSATPANVLLSVQSEVQVPTTDGSITTLTVVITKGTCGAQATVTFDPREVSGCTEETACNWTPGASIDNGTCFFFGEAFYDCETGFAYTPSPDDGGSAVATFFLLTVVGNLVTSAVALNEGDVLSSGIHRIRIQCSTGAFQDSNLSVPVCWVCNPNPGADCAQSGGISGPNIGWNSQFDCIQANQCVDCDTSLDVTVTPFCTGGIGRIQVTVNAGIGPYNVTVQQDSQAGAVVDQSLNIAPGTGIIYDRSIFADGVYYVSVIDGTLGCEKTFTFEIEDCYSCVPGAVTISGASFADFCDDGVITFNTFNTSAIPNTPYTVALLNPALAVVASQLYNTFGTARTLVVANPDALAAGSYTLRLTDLNGCTDEVVIALAGCGTTDCELVSASLFGSATGVGSTVTFTVQTGFSSATGESFLITIQRDLTSTAGTGCGQPTPNWQDFTTQAIVATSTLVTTFIISLGFPVAGACFRALIEKTTGDAPETCTIISNQFLIAPASSLQPPCTIIDFDCVYDDVTDTLTVTWDVDNTPANGVYLDIFVDSVIHPDSPSGVPAQTVLVGETGVFNLVIPQLSDAVQNIEVQLDGGSGTCVDTCMLVIPTCTCGIVINSVTYDGTNIAIDYVATCPTLPVGITLSVDLYSDIFCSIFDSSIGGDVLTEAEDVFLFPYPPPSGTEYIRVLLQDSTVVACEISECIEITGCGNNCDQIVSLGYFGGSGTSATVITSIDAVGAVNIVTGTYITGGANDDVLEADIIAALEGEGSACDGQSALVRNWGADVDDGGGRGPYLVVENSTVVLNTVSIEDSNGDPQTSYWGNCTGCDDDHLCDYEFVITLADILDGSHFAEIAFGSGMLAGTDTSNFDLTDAGDRTALEGAITDVLDGTGHVDFVGVDLPCAYTVGAVTVVEVAGVVTITINDTNAPIGQFTYLPAVATPSGLAFISATQSGCVGGSS